MSDLAPLLQRFFTDKLDGHMGASVNTKAAYADTFRLLLLYTQDRTGIAPSALTLAHLDADLVGGFLQHLETERGNSAATRNARRAALRSFFTYASYRAPDSIVTISRVLAIPAKRMSAYDLICRGGYGLTCRSWRGDHGMGSVPVTRVRRSLRR